LRGYPRIVFDDENRDLWRTHPYKVGRAA
jgi:hypothetical protein